MEGLILSSIATLKPSLGIQTQTCKRNDITNSQEVLETNPFLGLYTEASLKAKYFTVRIRTGCIEMYNCHGMTFANRRTGIHDAKEVDKIIVDDHYTLVKSSEVLPGDIVIYYTDDGDAEHSGIVVQEASKLLAQHLVLSKWGSLFEAIHGVYDCPYDKLSIKYYRAHAQAI